MSDCQNAAPAGIYGFESASGHEQMSHDTKHTSFPAEPASAALENAPALKTWVSPKIIVSTLSDDTDHSAGVSNDGGGASLS